MVIKPGIKISVVILLITIGLSTSCQERDPNTHPVRVEIKFKDISKIERGVVNIEKRVFLETNQQCMFSYPLKIVDYKGLLFILTSNNNGTILIFNKNTGQFVHKINHTGKGPGEYIKIKDFALDKENDLIMILDESACIYGYTFNDEFKEKIKLIDAQETGLRHLALVDNKIVTEGMDFDGKSIFIFNKNGTLIDASLKAPLITAFLPSPLTLSGEKLYYHKKMCDTIFRWNHDHFEPAVYIDFGRFKVSANEIFKIQREHPGKMSGIFNKPTYLMKTFFETNSFYYFDVSMIEMQFSKSNYFHCFVRKSDNKALCIEHLDLFKGILRHGYPFVGISEDGNSLISFLFPVELFEYQDELVKKKGEGLAENEYGQLQELCDSSHIDDNPIVIFVNLKNE